MKLAAFAKWIVDQTFEGSEPDGFEIQDYAIKCGILKETTYDPAKHGESEFDADIGDPYLEHSPEFKAAIAAEAE